MTPSAEGDAEFAQALFSVGRPGSRTVLCDPPESLVVELCRRGYRLLLLHSGELPVAEIRRKLRGLGLSSQLMGAQLYSAHTCEESEVKLPARFYELWIFCSAPSVGLLKSAESALQGGSWILWDKRRPASEPLGSLDGLPEALAGVRAP